MFLQLSERQIVEQSVYVPRWPKGNGIAPIDIIENAEMTSARKLDLLSSLIRHAKKS
jgi:hypothetical protein